MEILVFIATLCVLSILTQRFGFDSRPGIGRGDSEHPDS